MKQRIIQATKIFILLGIGFVAGTIFGFREGSESFYLLESVPKGAQAVDNLRQMEKGNAEIVKFFLNNDVDQGLYNFSLTEEKWWFPLYKRDLVAPGLTLNTEFIQTLADYRRKNPIARDAAAFDNPSPKMQEIFGENVDLAKFHRDRLKRVSRVIERYSKSGN